MTDPLLNNSNSPPCPERRDTRRHELVLVKAGQRYVFRCAPGEEFDLLVVLADLVRDPDTDLNWYDAAVLAHVLGRRLGGKPDQLTSPATQ